VPLREVVVARPLAVDEALVVVVDLAPDRVDEKRLGEDPEGLVPTTRIDYERRWWDPLRQPIREQR
jgi:5,10-methenyltetrahydromethanopterin hydrogenase